MSILEYIHSTIRKHSTLIGILTASISILLVFHPEVQEFLNQNEGAMSAVLSLLLVILYFAQYRLQNKQQRTMEISNEPFIQIEGYRGGFEGLETENLEVDLSNIGTGVAHNLRLKVITDFNHPQILEHETIRKLDKTQESEYLWFRNENNYQNPGEYNQSYYSSVGFRWKDLSKNSIRTVSLGVIKEKMKEYEINRFRIQFILLYDTPNNNEKKEQIADLMVPLQESYLSVNDILHYGLDYETYKNESATPGDPLEKHSYTNSPVGMSKYENTQGPPDRSSIPSLNELEEKLTEIEGEYIIAQLSSGLVAPITITNVIEDSGASGVLLKGRKETGNKNDIKIVKNEGAYLLFEDMKLAEEWNEIQEVIDITRKVENIYGSH